MKVFQTWANRVLGWALCLTSLVCGEAQGPHPFFEIRNRTTGGALTEGSLCKQRSPSQPCAIDFVGEPSQEWSLLSVDEGYYQIVNRHSLKALASAAVTCSKAEACRLVEEAALAREERQQWFMVLVSGAYFKIVNRSTGRALVEEGPKDSDSGRVEQQAYLGKESQQWSLLMADAGAQGLTYDPDPGQEATLFKPNPVDSCNIIDGTWSEDTTPPTVWKVRQHDDELSGSALSDAGSACGRINGSVTGAPQGDGSFALTLSYSGSSKENCADVARTRTVIVKLSYPGCRTGTAKESGISAKSTVWSRITSVQ